MQRGPGLDRACRTLRFWGQKWRLLHLTTSPVNPRLLLSEQPNPSAIPSEGRSLRCSREGRPSTVTRFLVCDALLALIARQSSQGGSSNGSELLCTLGHDIHGSSVSVYTKPPPKSLPKHEKAKQHYLVLLQQLITILSSTYFSRALAPQGQRILN